jgi:flavin-dependent dehydrogenase
MTWSWWEGESPGWLGARRHTSWSEDPTPGETGCTGGLATAGHIAIYLPLCDGTGNKVVSGIAEELLWDSIRYGGGNLPPEWEGRSEHATTQKRYQNSFNVPAFVLALDRLMEEAGVDLLFDTFFCVPVLEMGRCKAVIVENKSGRQAYLCRAVVDATGDADVLTRAGAPYAEQDNMLAYWAYCLTEESLQQAIDRENVKDLLKLFLIGGIPAAGCPKGRQNIMVRKSGKLLSF